MNKSGNQATTAVLKKAARESAFRKTACSKSCRRDIYCKLGRHAYSSPKQVTPALPDSDFSSLT